jgi:type I restriction enzyme S subunit
MEVRAGYKQTDVGVIPEDWEIHALKEEIGTLNAGISVNSVNEVIDIDNDFGVLKTSAVFGGLFNPLESKKIKSTDVYRAKLNPKADHIIISRMNTPDLVGECGYVISNYPKLFLPDRLWMLEFRKSSVINTRWLSYILSYANFRQKIRDIGTGTSGSMKNISKSKLLDILIPFPSKSEQATIAIALSETDALINSLEKLIFKKHNIKQGAMQKLLQPKKGWDVKKLGELGKPYGGLSGKSKIDFENGQYPYIPFMNIMSNPIIDSTYLDFVNIQNGESQNSALKGDLFFNGSSETPEEVGMCSVLLENIPNLYLNSFCFGYRLTKEYNTNGLYLAYYFRSNEGRKLFYSMAQGATRYNLSKSNFNKMEITLPKPEEQTHISTILFDMDAEITALETKLEKYRKVKLGMMQNLLTGKIRLTNNK